MIRQKTQDMLQALLPRDQMRRVPQDLWARMEPAQRIEELTAHSLDNCRDILDLPLAMAVKSPTVMTGKVQIIRAILTVVTKVGIESTRLREMQAEVLGRLIDDFDLEARHAPGRPAPGREQGEPGKPVVAGNGRAPFDKSSGARGARPTLEALARQRG